MPGGEINQRKRSRIFERDGFGFVEYMNSRNSGIFRESTLGLSTKYFPLDTSGFVSIPAVFTLETGLAGGNDDFVTDFHIGDFVADFFNDTGSFTPANMRHGRFISGNTVANPDIDMIERGRFNSHQNFVFFDLRVREFFFEFKFIDPTRFMK